MRTTTLPFAPLRRWLQNTTALVGAVPLVLMFVGTAQANPVGGTVAQGSATIGQSGNTTTITQTTNKAVINWQSFSIGANELTQFVQPSSSSVTLNRVTGDQVSQILGKLKANGQIFLVNPNGIVFGNGAQIDVAALTATTHGITDQNFMAGNYRFDTPGKSNAQIINQGTITATDGGLVALVAPSVRNSGLIQARLGKVALASGNSFTLDLYGDSLILFHANDKIASQVTDASGKPVSALVQNDGKVYADGGSVLMTANVAKGVVDQAVNMTGLVSARAVDQQGGEIVLKGEDSGIVQVSGTLDASGKQAGQKGGTVNVLGEKVGLLDNASIDVSGDAGGGTALVGGDTHGGGTVRTAQVTYMAQNATINANAITTGNGGKAIVWAEGTTRSYGRIFAQGGINGGNGGFVETSGKGFLDQTGTVNTLAPKGKTGTWLLDPQDIVIATGGNGTLDGTNSSLFSDNSGGTSTLDPLLFANATSNVTLQASRDITFSNAISMSNAGKALVAEAGRNLRVNANISTNNGDIFLLAGYDANTGQGGINNGVLLINGASVNGGSGNIALAGRGSSSLLTWNNAQNGVVVVNGGAVSTTTGNISVKGTGGNDGSVGVIVGDRNSKITSVDGNIDIVGVSGVCPGCYVGQGGVQVGGAGSEGGGVAGGLISVTGSGGLRIQGTGYNATWSEGVSVVDSGVISHTGTPAAGKKFEIIGNSASGDHSSWAVRIANSGSILTNDADLIIWGTAGNASWLDSIGISVADYGANGMPHITSTGQGSITLIGAPGSSAGGIRAGISIGRDSWTGERQAYIQTAGAPVTFQTDTLTVRNVGSFGPYVVGPGGANTATTSTVTTVAYGSPTTPSTTRAFPTPPAPGSNGNPYTGLDAVGLYTAIIAANLTNSYSVNTNWIALKLSNGGNATAAQVTADAMLNSYNRYKNLSGQALADKLFQDVVSDYTFDSGNGIYHMVNSSSNTLWKGSYGSTQQAGSAQVLANAMINTYTAYKQGSAQELANGLRSGAFTSNVDDLIWQALTINPNRAEALRLVSGTLTSSNAQNGQPGIVLTGEGSLNTGNGTSSNGQVALPPISAEYRDAFGAAFVDNKADRILSANIGISEASDKLLELGDKIKSGIGISASELQSARSTTEMVIANINRIKALYGDSPPEAIDRILDAWEAKNLLLTSNAWVTLGSGTPSAQAAAQAELKVLAENSALASGVKVFGKVLAALETEKEAMDFYSKIQQGENAYGTGADLAVNIGTYTPIVGTALSLAQAFNTISHYTTGNSVDDTLQTLKNIVSTNNTMLAKQIDSIASQLSSGQISKNEADEKLALSKSAAVKGLDMAMQDLSKPGFLVWMEFTSNNQAGIDIKNAIMASESKISQLSVSDINSYQASKMLFTDGS